MSSMGKQTTTNEEGQQYWVIAIVPEDTLVGLRDALTMIEPRSVIVSHAVFWSDEGPEYAYRGKRFRCDKNVVRVEIACTERQLERIVSAAGKAVAAASPSARDGSVVAIPVTHAGAPLPIA